MPNVRPDSLLTLHYRLAAPGGPAWVDTFGHNPATLTLGAQQLAPALEQCLIGLEEGAQARFELPPDVAFGMHDPQRVQRVPRSMLQQFVRDDVRLKVGRSSEQETCKPAPFSPTRSPPTPWSPARSPPAR